MPDPLCESGVIWIQTPTPKIPYLHCLGLIELNFCPCLKQGPGGGVGKGLWRARHASLGKQKTICTRPPFYFPLSMMSEQEGPANRWPLPAAPIGVRHRHQRAVSAAIAVHCRRLLEDLGASSFKKRMRWPLPLKLRTSSRPRRRPARRCISRLFIAVLNKIIRYCSARHCTVCLAQDGNTSLHVNVCFWATHCYVLLCRRYAIIYKPNTIGILKITWIVQ